MAARRGAGSPPQHHLVAHELPVVLAESASGRPVAGVAGVRARRPLPHVAVQLIQWPKIICRGSGRGVEAAALRKVSCQGNGWGGCLPLRLCWQTGPCPTRVGIRLVITDMANRFCGTWLSLPRQRHNGPLAVSFFPEERRPPPGCLPRGPAVG